MPRTLKHPTHLSDPLSEKLALAHTVQEMIRRLKAGDIRAFAFFDKEETNPLEATVIMGVKDKEGVTFQQWQGWKETYQKYKEEHSK